MADSTTQTSSETAVAIPAPAPPDDDDEEEDLFNADDDEEEQEKAEAPKTEPTTPAPNTGEATAEDTVAKEPSEPVAATPAEDAGIAKEQSPELKAAPLSADAPIPRVSAPSAKSTTATTSVAPSAESDNTAAKFGLPAGIVVPASVTPTLLQGRLLETLRGLPKQLINDALLEYDDAVQIKGESIRNHGAYLFGVIKRYVSVQERATSGEGEGILPMGPELTPSVSERLQQLVVKGFCTQEEMNDKVKSKIRMLSEKDALFAIEELSSVDRAQIRNFGSYFMGILNRYMRGERKDVTSGKKTLAEVRQALHQQQSPSHQRSDDRFQRGRDSEPHFRRGRDDPNEAYRRERSRDRFGGGPGGRRDSHDFQDPYSARNNQRPPYHGVQDSAPPPPPRPMPGGVNPYQPQPGPYGQRNQHPPLYGQPPMNPQLPPQQYAPQMDRPPHSSQYGNSQNGQTHPNMGGPMIPPQQYGRQPIVQQPPYGNLQQGSMPGMSSGMQGGNPQANSYGAPNQQMSHYMGQPQQPPQSYSNPPVAPNQYSQVPTGGQDRWGNQMGMQNAPASQGPPAVDIMALADKASSALQAVQGQHPSGMPHMQQQQVPPNPYGAPAPPYSQNQMSVPPSYPPPFQHQPPPNHGYGGGKPRRRTTATMADLPINVQYTVQNLQATGQINQLDDGMLGMVKDLPEDLALQALQKFSSIDKNTMRNPTAYLAGVLRRELERINRR